MKIKITGNVSDIIEVIKKFENDSVDFELIVKTKEEDKAIEKDDITSLNMSINRYYNKYTETVFNTIKPPNEMFTFIVKEKISHIKHTVFNVINGKNVSMEEINSMNSDHADIMDNLALHYDELALVNIIKDESVQDILRKVEATYQALYASIILKIKNSKDI